MAKVTKPQGRKWQLTLIIIIIIIIKSDKYFKILDYLLYELFKFILNLII
ncbi:hypothetical protein HanIR_Chr11g0549181 [Helianthus annuus]|nr:hypothetical protein HanIR_Chr11g0549181 [Helianthus annuus]